MNGSILDHPQLFKTVIKRQVYPEKTRRLAFNVGLK